QLSDTNGFAVVDFAARKEVARIKLPATTAEFETDAGRATAPSHGIGVAPDGKTLWVTSIPNNAVFVYSLADLKLIGEVALPALKLPGHDAIASVPNWVTFTPDSKTIYISNAAIKSVTAIDTESRTVKAVIPVGEVPKRITTLVTNGRLGAAPGAGGQLRQMRGAPPADAEGRPLQWIDSAGTQPICRGRHRRSARVPPPPPPVFRFHDARFLVSSGRCRLV